MTPTAPDVRIKIEAGVIPCGGGFVPVIVINGLASWDWRPHGYDRRIAARLAGQAARAQAARFVGDWHVTVRHVGEMDPDQLRYPWSKG